MAAAGAIGAIAQVGGAVVGMMGQQAAAEAQAQDLANQATAAKARAAQVATQYDENLVATLSNIRAIRAAAGVGAGSPTEQALLGEESRISDRNKAIEVSNQEAQASQAEDDINTVQNLASLQMFGTALGVVPSLFKIGQTF